MKNFIRRFLIWFTIFFFLTITTIFLIGILDHKLLADWWGTNEIAFDVKDKITGDISRQVISPAKTVWDLFNLLLVPTILAVGGYLINRAQQNQNQKIALDRDQEQTLQNYLDKMSELLLERRLSTTKSDVVLKLARSRTLTALRSLKNLYLDIDGRGRNRRKESLVRFLYEMKLISGDNPIVNLSKANLEYAYLVRGEFSNVNFSNVYLKHADLRKADLQGALLENAEMFGARLNGANLKKANLRKANLKGANLQGAILDGADFEGAIMPDGNLHE